MRAKGTPRFSAADFLSAFLFFMRIALSPFRLPDLRS
jgi:hypothetical protein